MPEHGRHNDPPMPDRSEDPAARPPSPVEAEPLARYAGPTDRDAPVSSTQRRILFLDRLQHESAFYTSLNPFRLTGRLDTPTLRRCLDEIVTRHEILRTVFPIVEGVSVQRVLPFTARPLPVLDLRALAPGPREREVDRITAAERRRPFVLADSPPFRCRLLRLSADEAILLTAFHHVAVDGWSLSVFGRELDELYEAFSVGLPSPLPPLPVQFAGYSRWQVHWETSREAQSQLAFWQSGLSGAPDTLRLPTDRPRPPAQSFRGANHRFTLDRALATSLHDLSRRSESTLYMTLLAALAVVLHRYSGDEDIVVGGAIANRRHPELYDLIGFFANTLLFRIRPRAGTTFEDLLAQVRHTCLDAYAHQDVSVDVIARQLFPERDLGRNPLYQVNFTLHNTPPLAESLSDLTVERLETESGAARFDLDLNIWDSPQGLGCLIGYSTDLFDASTVVRLAECLVEVLTAVAQDPKRRLGELPVMPAHEVRRLLHDWNDTGDHRCDVPLHELVEAQTRRTPHATAVTVADTDISYGELDRAANRLAHHLRAAGVEPGDIVAVLLGHGPDTIATLLAILKSGAAALPLHPAHPPRRTARALADSEATVLVTSGRPPIEPHPSGVTTVRLDTERDTIAARPSVSPGVRVSADDLVYLMYTSGSSGAPKAALLTHRNVVNYLVWAAEYYAVPKGSGVPVHSPTAFDLTVTSIFAPLLSGQRLLLAAAGTDGPGEALRTLLANAQDLSLVKLTPSHLRLLEQSAEDRLLHLPARTVVLGGEALYEDALTTLRAGTPGVRVINEYGPTETAVACTVYDATEIVHEDRVPIGRPIDNVRVYVLDPSLRPVPVGVRGELYVGGVGVGLGYWRRAAPSAENFVPDPFGPEPGARLYRTGDIVRHLPGGDLEYLGRQDNQVKVRGHRVELGEIEAVLCSHPAVRECAVDIARRAPGDEQLVAYIRLDDSLAQGDDWDGERVGEWRGLYESTYRDLRADDDASFNLAGWLSSYTGRPLERADMHAWLADTVTRIRELDPHAVLEIGCGTGMILQRVAPVCDTYTGTDVSHAAVEYVARALRNAPLPGPVRVEVRSAAAHESIRARAAIDRPDTIVLNSVAQYFPSATYLVDVLRQAVDALPEGGHVFLGDLRSLPLLRLFHLSVETHKAAVGMRVGELRSRVHRSMTQDPELCVDPRMFGELCERWPNLRKVEVLPKRGRYDNELSHYRYDVILTVGPPGPSPDTPDPAEGVHEDGDHNCRTPQDVADLLDRERPRQITLTGVPNARLSHACALERLLEECDDASSVGELRARALGSPPSGIAPEDWWDLASRYDYDVEPSWAAGRPDGSYDIVLRHRTPATPPDTRAHKAHDLGRTAREPLDARRYTNNPQWARAWAATGPDIAAHARESLPEPFLPARYIPIPEMPLTSNGKADRAQLRLAGSDSSTVYHPGARAARPLTETERAVADIWSELLRCEVLTAEDDFFGLGGHSLLVLQVVFRVRRHFAVDLPVRAPFDHRTLSELAACIDRLEGSGPAGGPALVPVDRAALMPASFAQERLWFTHQLNPNGREYTVPAFDRIRGPLNARALSAALDALVARHEVLRTAIVAPEGVPRQLIRPPEPVPLPLVDLTGLHPDTREAELRRLTVTEYRRPFDLAEEPVIRAHLIRLTDEDHALLLSFHHIVHDGWSFGLLTFETASLYHALDAGTPPDLAPLAVQYADYAVWQRRLLDEGHFDGHLEFWQTQLRGVADLPPLRTDHPRPSRAGSAGRLLPVDLPRETVRGLRALCAGTGVTPFMVLLASLGATLHSWTGEEDVVIGTDVANRSAPETEALIGFFVNQLVLRISLAGGPTWKQLLERARGTVLDALRHQDVPFERVLQALNPPRGRRYNPLFQAKLVLNNTPHSATSLPGLQVTPLHVGLDTARFDLALVLDEDPESISGFLEYNVDLFDESTVTGLLGTFTAGLESLIRRAGRPVSEGAR